MAKNPSSGGGGSLDGMSAEVAPMAGRSLGTAPVGLGGAAVTAGPREPTAREKLGVWLRVGLGVAAGAFMTQWPYRHACGLPLYLYLGAVTVVIVAGGWAGVSSWKRRMAKAHVLSLSLVLWGLVLAAAQVLPRIGYAAHAATWRCL